MKGGNIIKKINSVQDWLPFEEVLDNRYNKIKKQFLCKNNKNYTNKF